MEYFDRQFLFKIGENIGRVIRIDKNTESMDRGQYIRLCIEVDLTKPLLSKFRLNGRVWKIQYEGLRQICFKCGHLGHKEDNCVVYGKEQGEQEVIQEEVVNGKEKANQVGTHKEENLKPEEVDNYGTWMMVQRTTKRNIPRPRVGTNRQQQQHQSQKQQQQQQANKGTNGRSSTWKNGETNEKATDAVEDTHIESSRFAVLDIEGEDLMETEQLPRNVTMEGNEEGNDLAQAGNTPKLGEDENMQGENRENDLLIVEDTNERNLVHIIDLAKEGTPFFMGGRSSDNMRGLHANAERYNKGRGDSQSATNSGSFGINSQLKDINSKNTPQRSFDIRKSPLPTSRVLKPGKENSLPNTQNLPLNSPISPTLTASTAVQRSDHEFSSPTDHLGMSDPPGLLDIHRLHHRRSNDGISSPSSQQSGTPSEFVPPTDPQSTGSIGHGPTRYGVTKSYECPSGSIYRDSA